MLTENQKKWISALRSGEYQQGKHKLQTDSNSFCCLGVACKVYEKETGVKLPTDSNGNIKGGCLYSYKQVMRWVGLRTDTGKPKNGSLPLTKLNDRGISFRDIADILEISPEEYFAQEDDDE